MAHAASYLESYRLRHAAHAPACRTCARNTPDSGPAAQRSPRHHMMFTYGQKFILRHTTMPSSTA